MGVAIGVDSWLKIVFIKSTTIFGSSVLKEKNPFLVITLHSSSQPY